MELSQRFRLGQTIPKGHTKCNNIPMNIYGETIINMAHLGFKSEIKLMSENTKKAHQIAKVK